MLAVYAAILSTFAVLWNIWTWRQARRPIDVRVALAAVGASTDSVWCVAITAINRGEHTVTVKGAGLFVQDGSGAKAVMLRALHPVSSSLAL